MKNIVLCFDCFDGRPETRAATHAQTLFRLFDGIGGQTVWYHPGTPEPAVDGRRRRVGPRRQAANVDDTRATIVAAYEFLLGCWEPTDWIFLFGAGRGGYCAQALARLLGTVGVLPDRCDNLSEYVLATYAMPRTERTAQDWQRVNRLAGLLAGGQDIRVPVHFLGLWDTVKPPGQSRSGGPEPLTNVLTGRHAVAIDGGPRGEHGLDPERIEEVWFRGSHGDVAGGTPLAGIPLDWILDGAVAAGALVRDDHRFAAPAPSESDALIPAARTPWMRKLPADAAVHASVDVYLRSHPRYWRRLPARVAWADRDWLARGERLVSRPRAPIVAPVASELLTAAS